MCARPGIPFSAGNGWTDGEVPRFAAKFSCNPTNQIAGLGDIIHVFGPEAISFGGRDASSLEIYKRATPLQLDLTEKLDITATEFRKGIVI